MGNPFDSIPVGKKPIYDTAKGWHLVDLDHANYDDLLIIFNENKAKIKKQEDKLRKIVKENEELKQQVSDLDVSNQELALTLEGLKKGKK